MGKKHTFAGTWGTYSIDFETYYAFAFVGPKDRKLLGIYKDDHEGVVEYEPLGAAELKYVEKQFILMFEKMGFRLVHEIPVEE